MITENINPKVLQQLVQRFQKENSTLSAVVIQHYVQEFQKIRNKPEVTKKDPFQYTWRELENTVDTHRSRNKVKNVGKLDHADATNSDLIYNQGGLRVYRANSKNACIRYGNGYSFCISARGSENMYNSYRFGDQGTPYFIFDDSRSFERDENGDWVDPQHALVFFVYGDPAKAKVTRDDYWDEEGWSEYRDYPYDVSFSVTDANNHGDTSYHSTRELLKAYPQLKPVLPVMVPLDFDTKEKADWDFDRNWDARLEAISAEHGELVSASSLEKNVDWDRSYALPMPTDVNFNGSRYEKLLSGEFRLYRAVFSMGYDTGEPHEVQMPITAHSEEEAMEVAKASERESEHYNMKLISLEETPLQPQEIPIAQKLADLAREYKYARAEYEAVNETVSRILKISAHKILQ